MNTIHHERKNMRCQNFNYQKPGYYFITICSNGRQHFFGEIINEKMFLNKFGKIIYMELLKTQQIRQHIQIDTFVIMPNHIHLILQVQTLSQPYVGAYCIRPDAINHKNTFQLPKNNVGSIIRGLKSACTKIIRTNNGPYHPFQRNYHDIIIHNNNVLQKIRHYIKINPKIWVRDRNNI